MNYFLIVFFYIYDFTTCCDGAGVILANVIA